MGGICCPKTYEKSHIKKRIFCSSKRKILFLMLFLKLGQCISQGCIFKVIILFLQIFIYIFFGYFMLFLTLFPFIEGREFLTVTTFTRKYLTFPFTTEFKTLMTVRTACISYFGNIFSVSATTILTDEHAPIFILYFKHELAAIWALGSCHIVMFKRRITLLYLLNNFFGVTFHFRDEMAFLQPSFSDQPQLLFPFGCKSRRFQIFRNEIKQLSAF